MNGNSVMGILCDAYAINIFAACLMTTLYDNTSKCGLAATASNKQPGPHDNGCPPSSQSKVKLCRGQEGGGEEWSRMRWEEWESDEYGKEGGIGSGRGKVLWHGTHQTFHSQDWSTFTSQCRFVPGKIVAITVAINFATNNMSELAHDGSMGLIWRKEIMFPYKKEASRCQNSPARQHIVTIALLTAHGTR